MARSSDAIPRRPSCRRRRCPQAGDKRQNVGEHLSRHRDLGRLERSLTSLREKLIKIGAKVVSHGRYVTFQMAEVAVP